MRAVDALCTVVSGSFWSRSSPCDDVLVKLPSTSCAIVALDRSGAASGCEVAVGFYGLFPWNGRPCCLGGVMVRWPCSSRAGGWHFEVWPSFARQLPKAVRLCSLSRKISRTFLPLSCLASVGYDVPILVGSVLGLQFDEALKPHREDGQFAAGSLSVGNGYQASGRVDVPSGNISVATCELQRSPDASAAAAKSTELVELVRFFVRALNSSSFSFSMRQDQTILDLLHRLSVRTGVPHHLFYHAHTCGRLRGGAGGGRVQIEGEGTVKIAA